MRDWYLASMGVVQYRPRAPVWDGVEPEHSVAPDFGAASSDGASRLEFAAELPSTPSERIIQPEAAPVPPLSAAEEPIAFRLACWQPTEDLLIIDSLPPGEEIGAARARLLGNIVAALLRFRRARGGRGRWRVVRLGWSTPG